jgi:hypothetical protein
MAVTKKRSASGKEGRTTRNSSRVPALTSESEEGVPATTTSAPSRRASHETFPNLHPHDSIGAVGSASLLPGAPHNAPWAGASRTTNNAVLTDEEMLARGNVGGYDM